MTNLEREELLSAYLDGEVTADERARVERWLAESSELRQLRDELVAMRAEIQSLPRQTLGHDLAAAVMRRTGPAAPLAPAGKGDVIVPGTLAKWWERGSGARRLMWPAIAAAAALAILIFDANQRPGEQQVAQAPRATAESSDLSDKYSSSEKDAVLGAPAADAANTADAASAPGDTYRAQEKMERSPRTVSGGAPLEYQSAEMKRNRDAVSDGKLAAPSTPLSAPVPEAAMPKAAEPTLAGRSLAAAGSKADAPPTIICPVSPAYLQGNDFENLLTTNKIEWQRLPVSPQQKLQIEAEQRQSKVAAMQSLGAAPLQTLYYLRASGEQVNEVLSQVPQAAKLFEGNRVQLPRMTASQQKQADEAAQGVQVLLVAPSEAVPTTPPAKPIR